MLICQDFRLTKDLFRDKKFNLSYIECPLCANLQFISFSRAITCTLVVQPDSRVVKFEINWGGGAGGYLSSWKVINAFFNGHL